MKQQHQQTPISYLPWDNTGNAKGLRADTANAVNLAIKDPSVIISDAWNFPAGLPLTLSAIANVHRGTPWQTVYLKSASTPLTNWETWTSDTNAADAALSEPTNDWGIVASLLPFLGAQHDPHLLYGFNQSLVSAWAPAFQGLTVISNTTAGPQPYVIDDITDSNSIVDIVGGINTVRSIVPDHLFTNAAQLLAVPQLSVQSPFMNLAFNPQSGLYTDAEYESLPAQLLPLLRPDPIGTFSMTNGVPRLQFTGFDGYAYVVQASTDMQNWTPIATEYPTNGSFTFTDTNYANLRDQYYRTMLAP